jgi:hypothetical protein
MLVGAVGGLLSRLMQNLKAAKVSNDYGASWGSLFLSPLTGALAAWGGILLMILAAQMQILGKFLSFDWSKPYEPVTLAVALLLGFTERLFDNVVMQIETKLLPTTTEPGAAGGGASGAGASGAGASGAGASGAGASGAGAPTHNP